MLLPTVAIVGRPNVGKSRLFNRLVGAPVSIVDPTAGVTRDRILHPVERDGLRFDLIDTGGIGLVDAAQLEDDVHRQIDRAIAAADCIVFLTDGRSGPLGADQAIVERLRPLRERVVLAVNKVDAIEQEAGVAEFTAFGLGEPVPISAERNRGIHRLLEAIGRHLPRVEAEARSAADDTGRIRICLAGRRNVGKSTLTNRLCGEERVIVSEHAGTTRDAVDVALDVGEDRFLLIDTAGLRKKRQLREDLEFYAACRTEQAILRADVVVLMLDATDEIGTVDKKLAHFCQVESKPTLVVINKWDLVEGPKRDESRFKTWLADRLPGLAYAPVVCTSAKDGRHAEQIFDWAKRLHEEARMRVSTAECNRLLQTALVRRRPASGQGGSAKIYYLTQVTTNPPRFVAVCNRADRIDPSFARFLENYLRAHLPFPHLPLRLTFRTRPSRFRSQEHADAPESSQARPHAELTAQLVVPRRRHSPPPAEARSSLILPKTNKRPAHNPPPDAARSPAGKARSPRKGPSPGKGRRKG